MPGKQVSISKSKAIQPVIDEARSIFPDAATDSQALTRALLDWHGRQLKGATTLLIVTNEWTLTEDQRDAHQSVTHYLWSGTLADFLIAHDRDIRQTCEKFDSVNMRAGFHLLFVWDMGELSAKDIEALNGLKSFHFGYVSGMESGK